ncbi:MAG: hypothetical protein AAF845_07745 [Bacteroidota bacterium]
MTDPALGNDAEACVALARPRFRPEAVSLANVRRRPHAPTET